MKTNAFAETAAAFVGACSKIPFTDKPETVDLSPVLATLPHVSLDRDHILEAVTPGCTGMGGETAVHIRRRDIVPPPAEDLAFSHSWFRPDGITSFTAEKNDDDGEDNVCTLPFGHFHVEESEEGYWEAFLLSEMWRFLPLFWHAGYAARTLILDADELPGLAHVSEELIEKFRRGEELPDCMTDRVEQGFYGSDDDIRRIFSLTGNDIVLPRVTRTGSGCEITYHYWTEWGGLVCETDSLSIDREGNMTVRQMQSTCLAEYDCCILF